MKIKINIWIYSLAAISAIYQSYLAFIAGNMDAALPWGICAGLSAGAIGAYLELLEKDKE